MTTDLVIWLLFLFVGILAVPIVVFFVQVLSAFWPTPQCRTFLTHERPRLALLVPAHNESLVIETISQALRDSLFPGDRLVVIADNCSDDTDVRARKAGAEVIVRNDAARVGKGYALDFGISHLAMSPPDVVIVVDADCVFIGQSLDHLARACHALQRPAQAVYTMRNPPGASLRMRIAEFAGIVKNHVRPLGFHRFRLPCMLMGTGMAFPWTIISRANVATGHIVEDMKLGVDLACNGFPPIFFPHAEVTSYFPDSLQGFMSQRQRWEHGHLGVIISETPRLLLNSIRQRDGRLLGMALDLTVPPLALLALLVFVTFIASALIALLTHNVWPLTAIGLISLLLLSGVFLAWAKFGQHIIAASELTYAPIYALLKIPMYLRYIYDKQIAWVRSARKGE